MRIKKIINNNIVCAVDRKGSEVIVSGCGIGFKRRKGEEIDPAQIEKIYKLDDKIEQKKLRELVEEIPLEHLKLTQELMIYIKSKINQEMNEKLLITLADHISFAIKRKKQGIEFKNAIKNEIRCYYPLEYQLGQYCLSKIEEKYDITLNEDESAFIALHIVNAELNTSIGQIHEITRLLEECVQITEEYYGKKINRNSFDFNHFTGYLRYLIQCLYQDKTVEKLEEESDITFRQMVQFSCRRHFECAKKLAAHIRTECGKEVPEEELIYLSLQLKRLMLG